MNNKIKTILLVILICISVVQSFELWFGGISDRNFFYMFLDNESEIERVEYNESILSKPYSVIVNYENGEQFLVENIKDDYIIKETNNIIEFGINKIDSTEKSELYWDDILNKRGILYEYSVNIPIEGIEINNIMIVPSKSKYIEYYFINTYKNEMYTAKLSYDENDLYEKIGNTKDVDYMVKCFSSSQKNISLFNENIFIPVFEEELENDYKEVYLKNPFVNKDIFDFELFENYIDDYFEDPSLKWMSKQNNGTYIYSDDNIVIRYYPSEIIEYKYTENIESTIKISLENAYNVAMNFLSKDKLLDLNNLYLREYENDDKGIYLYFDYKIKNYIYEMSEEEKIELGMDYPIEIYIINNKVVSYKTLCKEIYLYDKKEESINVPYTVALDEIIKSSGSDENKINDMYLAYYEDVYNELNLVWMINLNGKWYHYNAN